MDLELTGRVVAITGGSEGIGLGTALSLAREGARVAICARRAGPLQDARSQIEAVGGEAFTFQADVTQREQCEAFVAATVGEFGSLYGLVSNAGRADSRHFSSLSDDDWAGDFDLKLWPAIWTSRAAVPHMRQAGEGRIVLVTTPAGKAPGASSLPTSVSRAAGIALSKAMSKDLAADGIHVNTVCVSSILTANIMRRWERSSEGKPREEFAEALGRKVLIGRLGRPQEVGDVIAFLMSQRASFVVGAAINVDGGSAATT